MVMAELQKYTTPIIMPPIPTFPDTPGKYSEAG
jgi:hypothetical protein